MDGSLATAFYAAVTSGIFFIMPASTILIAPIPILMAKDKTIDRSSYIAKVIYSFLGYLIYVGVCYTLFIEVYKSDKIFIFQWRESIFFGSAIAYSVIINASAKRLNGVGQSRWKAWTMSIPLIGPLLILIFQKEPKAV